MGQSKGGGYIKKETVTPEQNTLVNQLLQQALPNFQGAQQGYQQFLPGGVGGQPLINQANQNFQQQTLPSIMNAFGSGARSSSALNQALAAGAAGLNSNIAAQLAQLQLGASEGLGNLGSRQAALGSLPLFAYLQKQPSRFQTGAQGAITGAGAGSAAGPWGAAAGGLLGGLLGAL